MDTYEHFASLVEWAPGVKTILDAPAGPGRISRMLKDKKYEVTACDIHPEVFEPKDVKCDPADLNARLPYPDASFDMVVCREGIEHVENQFHTAREFRRVLKPGGWLLFSTPNLMCIRGRLAMLLVGGRDLKDRPPLDKLPYTGGDHINIKGYLDLRAVFRRSGFQIEKVTTYTWSVTSVVWAWLIPFIMFFSWRSFRREKFAVQREANKQVWQHLFSPSMLFGQKLIVLAKVEAPEPAK
jgi:SAM-dependent methyltransferase